MAKKSMIARDVKELLLLINMLKKSRTKKRVAAGDMEAMFELNKLPKDSSVVRKRNRCQLDGRLRGIYERIWYFKSKIQLAGAGNNSQCQKIILVINKEGGF